MSSETVHTRCNSDLQTRAPQTVGRKPSWGEQQFGVDPVVATRIARDVGEIQGLGVETAIVIGGGNIFRWPGGQYARAWTAPPPTTWACWRP
jgi:hypothetical protein